MNFIKKKIIIILAINIFISFKVFANIIYEKNNIIITNIEVNVFINYFKDDYLLNTSEAIKQIYLIKRLVNNLKKFNPKYLENIDKSIEAERGTSIIIDEAINNAFRYSIIRNDFIINYIMNNFTLEELSEVFEINKEFKIPISQNECLVYSDIVRVKDNKNILELIYNLFTKDDNQNMNIIINKKNYLVCIDNDNFSKIQNIVFKYLYKKIQTDFENYLYRVYNEI